MRSILLVLALCVFPACHKRVPFKPVSGEGYWYVQHSKDTFIVLHLTDVQLERAKKQIGCGVCAHGFSGEVTVIERVR